MRRLIFPSSLFILVASLLVIAAPGPAGAAGTARSVPHILCPQPHGQPTVVPCCPLPTNAKARASAQYVPCCPQASNPCCTSGTNCCTAGTTCCTAGTTCCTTGTTCCTTGTTCCTTTCPSGGLSIAASPDPSTAGRKVVISGGLTSNPASGAQVVLWRELSGQSSFHQLAQTTTDSAGQYTFTMKTGSVNADQQWYVTSNGLTSPTLAQKVNALVGLASASHTVTAGQAVALSGQVTPSHAGQVLLIEQRRGGTWAVIGRPRLTHASAYKLSHKFMHAGAIKLRAVLPADARNNRSNSPTLTVTVK
jgi:hypothetical protein